MCGIFGFNGWDKANVAKLKMLGLYNKSRGKDSCGYWFNYQLQKGIGLKKEWNDFIEAEIIDEKGPGNVFIGHTRAATVGSHTEENAHPFNVNDKLIIAHNGTLENAWDLCNHYGIDHKDIHVDSLALGHLIQQEGYRVLSEYKGYAALLIHRLSEPDSLYVFHGASRIKVTDEKPTEERPLFFMKTKEGVYFSSMKNSLMAIRDSVNQMPEVLEHNRLFKITKGKFSKAKTIIAREDVNLTLQKKTSSTAQQNSTACSYPTPTNAHHSSHTTQTVGTNKYNHPGLDLSRQALRIVPTELTNTSKIDWLDTDPVRSINPLEETKPPRCFNNTFGEYRFLYFYRGRHFYSDERANHIYPEGIVYTDKDGVVYDAPADKVRAHYFYRGVMLRGEKEWQEIQHCIVEKNATGRALVDFSSYNFAQFISRYSKYPVTNLLAEGVMINEDNRISWYMDVVPAKGSIQPVWADRNYVFKKGFLCNIIPEYKNDKVLSPNEYANANTFSQEKTTANFKDGLVIIKNPSSMTDVDRSIQYFDVVYDSLDELMRVGSKLFFKAVNRYTEDLIAITTEQIADDETIKDEAIHFLRTCIEDKVTVREAMDDNMSDPEDYLRKVYITYIEDDNDDDGIEESPIDVLVKEDNKKKEESQTSKEQEALSQKYVQTKLLLDAINGENNQEAAISEFLKEEKEEQEVEDIAKKIVTCQSFLRRKVADLQAMKTSRYAVDLTNRILNITDLLQDGIIKSAEEFGKTNILNTIKEKNK